MQRDPIVRAPHSSECGENIQEYTTQFNIFITMEWLNKCTYTEREQVLYYMRGLSEDFGPAIFYINTLMQAWGQTGLNPVCKLKELPRTIENFMNQTGGASTGMGPNGSYPIIRVAKSASDTPEKDIQLDELKQLLHKHMETT
jgi:hypothetical protein